jgi:outer membrane protein assembly factor BamB
MRGLSEAPHISPILAVAFGLALLASVDGLEQPAPTTLPSGPLSFGSFTARFAADRTVTIVGDGWPTFRGTWKASAGEIELATSGGPPECASPGRYRFRIDGRGVRFDVVTDRCTPRRMIVDRSTWTPTGQAEATPPRRILRTSAAARPALEPAGSAAHSWPSFRGAQAAGVARGQHIPDHWNGVSGQNILWRIPIPGLGHSSPIVWGERLFVTTAISGRPKATFKPGLYGDGDASDDHSRHRWVVYALDKRTGSILWERVAHEGEPRNKRHVKSTYASSTPATDGRILVAWFGSEGVYAYDLAGNPLWTVDLGRLDVGAYDIPTYEWGPASSPVIWNGLVILQCDTQADSFLLALEAETGATAWKTDRDELPSWGTPTVAMTSAGPELVTNGSNYIRGYDPRTGKELWRLGRSSKITAPSPVFADDLFVVTSGREPERPIFAVRAGARGDVTPRAGAAASRYVAWSRTGRGPYMPTPVILDGWLYVLANNGIFDAYDLKTGTEVYRRRLPYIGNGYSASPVAADGKIYLSSEDGEMLVVRAGPIFEHVATNSMGELLMATPALSDGVMYVRTASSVFAIGARR